MSNISFGQDYDYIKNLYKNQKFGKINTICSNYDKSVIINSPCINYYLLSLEKKNRHDIIIQLTEEIIKNTNPKKYQLPDSIINAVTTCYMPTSNYASVNTDLSQMTRWFLGQQSSSPLTYSRIYEYYKLRRYKFNDFAIFSSFLAESAQKYILLKGVNDEIALDMMDILNNIFKQSASGRFLPYETKTKEKYTSAIKNGYIFSKPFTSFDIYKYFNFSDFPEYSSWISYEGEIMAKWYDNLSKIEKLDTNALNYYYTYFTNNYHFYKASVALNAKLIKTGSTEKNYIQFYEALTKIPYEMIPYTNQVFKNLLATIYDKNKDNCHFQNRYINFLNDTKQYTFGKTHVQKLYSSLKNCLNRDSLILEFRILEIFNKKEFHKNPPIVFSNAIDSNIQFFRINQILKQVMPSQNKDISSNVLFTLYKNYPHYKDSIWWGMCDHLFPKSGFSETKLKEFKAFYIKTGYLYGIENVEYDLWNGKPYAEILEAIKNNKVSKTPGWQIIAEYGIYYYSESESRNSTETKKIALILMKQAAQYFRGDGDLQKHIGHCLFLLGNSAEAQAYYKRAISLGANMTDVGAYGGKGTKTGPRGGKSNFTILPGTIKSK